MRSALIVFLKYPQPGAVKTRLAAETSGESAADFYKLCTEFILNEVAKLRSEEIYPVLFIDDKNNEQKIRDWTGGIFPIHSQVGNELGTRMSNAFKYIFDKGFNRAVIIGTDIPDLFASDIKYAFSQLSSADIVVGPSNDGGYYLLGMNDHHSILFHNFEWSSSSVLHNTLNKIEQKNQSYLLLPRIRDIDYKEDLVNWIREAGGNRKFKSKAREIFGLEAG